jgi:hypothetical protein
MSRLPRIETVYHVTPSQNRARRFHDITKKRALDYGAL